jgi:hypothetical protein
VDIGSIYDMAHSFETDVDAVMPTRKVKVSAATVERVRMMFQSVYTTLSHASSAEACGLTGDRTMYLIRVAFVLGRLSEIFRGMKAEGWVERSIALTRVVENVVTGRDRPV